jgi:hypothetical protein
MAKMQMEIVEGDFQETSLRRCRQLASPTLALLSSPSFLPGYGSDDD